MEIKDVFTKEVCDQLAHDEELGKMLAKFPGANDSDRRAREVLLLLGLLRNEKAREVLSNEVWDRVQEIEKRRDETVLACEELYRVRGEADAIWNELEGSDRLGEMYREQRAQRLENLRGREIALRSEIEANRKQERASVKF